MLKPRKTIDAGATRAKLDDLVGAVRREVEDVESGPSDDAMLAAVVGIAEALKAEAELEARLGRLARRTPR